MEQKVSKLSLLLLSSSEDINSTVLIYENDAVSQSTIEIRYKARTSSTLPASIFINSSFVMSYTSLPKNLNQSLARKYSYGPISEVYNK